MCEFCERFDFGNARADIRDGHVGIAIAGESSKFPKEEQFRFCPVCGASREEVTMNEHKVQASMIITLTNQDIDDIMVTALEGGINNWCCEVEVIGEYLGEYASDQISRGGTLRFLEIEESDMNTDITLTSFLEGVKLCMEHGILPVDVDGNIDAGMVDAELADCIVQYGLFGEIVYG